jgi:beta-fructofuranosidase
MDTEPALAVRQRFTDDPHRPRYHYLPPSNWMNDPNGVIQWQGQYHLFYQHNPHAAVWGDIHWGHAVSDDLIRWTDLPIALAPTPGNPDETGVFSGCAVNNDGVPTLIYTGATGEQNDHQTQCLATSQDGLLTWEKYAGNPVLSAVPPEANQTADFRDPFVWRDDDDEAWYMAVGSRIKDVGGAVFLYRSQNLIDWDYLNPLLVGDQHQTGVTWECPNFFQLGDQWVLIVSAHTGTATGTVFYFVGHYENYRFTPTHQGVLDYGHLYAPLTMLDDHGRRLLFGWAREARSEVDQRIAGWSGLQSIPRILTLDNQQRLQMTPVPELETIRGHQTHYEAHDLNQSKRLDATGLNLDIVAEFEVQSGGHGGLSLACSPDGSERVDLLYEADKQNLIARKVTVEPGGVLVTHIREVPHRLAADEGLKLRVLLDGSVVEVIANDRTSVVSRFYPTNADNNGVQLLGAKARLRSMDVYEMPSIWE